ncbi:predicted protein, partial [Nematostella vectensis]
MAAASCVCLPHLLLFLGLVSPGIGSYVVELDDRFAHLKEQGSWLVEFYAPWCGYCRKLEPVYEEVAKTLHGSSINVAKLDATVYSGISREYGVRGFPTIKFIKGKKVINYEGDRTAQDIIQFAQKASGPAVRELTSGEELRKVQRERPVFFLLVQKSGEIDTLKDHYDKAADMMLTKAYFYSIDDNQLPKSIKINAPAISVFKDGRHFEYEVPDDVAASNISDWVSQEQFPAFIQITRTNIHEIGGTGRSIVFVVFAESSKKSEHNH